MDILKQKRITDGGDKYLANAINYLFKEKTDEGERLIETRGYGVSDTSPEFALEQMRAVKQYFGKTGDNPLMHFIVSFDNSVSAPTTACKYTEQIADRLSGDYQVLTAVHKEDQGGSQYHGHIVANSVSYNDGKLYHSGITELKQLAMCVHDITGHFCNIEIE